MTLSCPGPPVTFQSLAPAAAASTAPAPRSPSLQAANMEELLKGIPPNVSIPTTADQQTGGLVEQPQPEILLKMENWPQNLLSEDGFREIALTDSFN